MKKGYVLALMIFGSICSFAQTTVFIDDFSTNQSATYTTSGAIGASAWSVTRSGADWGARRNTAPAQLELTNDVDATANVIGWTFAATPVSGFTPPYNATLNLNPGLITWTFNMRTSRGSALAGFGATNSYGMAYILSSTSNTPNTTGNGYAVVMGGGGLNTISLITFTGGLQGTRAVVIAYAGAPAALTNYLSVKVTYNPIGDAWELFNRDDGNTAFADPAAGTLTSLGTATNSTYTATSMTYSGAYWQGSTAAAQTAFFDNTKVTVVAGGTPTINVSTPSLSGFLTTSAVPSTVQTYTVDGSNLTTDITITPPTGYEISPAGPFTPTNPILLTPVAGTVGSTTIQVRLNSVPLGVIAGNITHTSTGATQKDVALTGKVIDAEPTIQSTITIGAITNSTVVVNFSGGNGARRILLAKLAVAVDSNPVDGTTYTANANFGSGTQLGTGNYVVYDGTGNTQLVTGLTAGATYHFSIYEYNNGANIPGAENYLVPGGTGNATLLTYSVPYVWIGMNGDWQVPANWAPARLFPATNDSLLFTSASVNDIITNVPTQTVGYIGASLLTGTTLQASAPGNTLTIGNLTGTDFFVEAGSSFNINTANALTLNVVTGATASISGNMTFEAGTHKLTAADANAVTFNSGAIFTAGTGFTSNAFGVNPTATANSVIFAGGSTYRQISGSNPFALNQPLAVVVFQTGSLFKLESNLTPSVSGRSYANFELDAPASVISASGTGLLRMDNVTITNGNMSFGMTTAGFELRGNVSVAAGGILNFAPASAGMLTFKGSSAQSISNAGSLTFGANQNVTIDNAASLTLNTPVTLSGSLIFTAGNINSTTTNLLTLGAAASVTGAGNASFVNGPVSKIGNTSFTFPVGKNDCGPSNTVSGYAPITITAPATISDRFTAEYVHSSGNALGPITAIGLQKVSACDYWILNQVSGANTLNVTLNWNAPINNCAPPPSSYVNVLPDLVVAHFDGTNWDAFGAPSTATGTPAAGNVTWPNVSTFSPFAIGSISFNNPLPITINYFNGTRSNGNHLLNWKVTCVSTPSATIDMERSTDGRNFSSIYSIFATALRCQQPFDHTDSQPAKGINYYRLKMTDADGKVTYSTTVTLINAVKGIEVMNIAPNPIVNGTFNLKISTAEKTLLELVITDMQGRVLQKRSAGLIAGFNQVPMHVRSLSAGTYQLFGHTADGRTRVLRFVVQ